MATLVVIRHGESTWNQENRFTGWVDVDLAEKGVQEAIRGGKALKEQKLQFDIVFTSVLKRAINTMNLVLNELDQHWLPIIKSWRLNERHYGELQGLNKSEPSTFLLKVFLNLSRYRKFRSLMKFFKVLMGLVLMILEILRRLKDF